MEVKTILLADYANISREGKLNVLGIFQEISAANFPAIHPQMQLVILWETSKAESGRQKEMEIQLRDADGGKMLSLNAEFTIPDGPSGRRIKGQHIIGLNMVKFEKPGTHAFHVLVGGDDKGSILFEVCKLK